MYAIARLLLIVAVLAGLYSLVLVIQLGWPATGWMVGILGLARYGRRGYAYLTTLGSARWATEREIRKAKMTDTHSGLFLGRLI